MTVMRGVTAGLVKPEGRSRNNCSSPSDRPSGAPATDADPTVRISKGPIQIKDIFSLSNLSMLSGNPWRIVVAVL